MNSVPCKCGCLEKDHPESNYGTCLNCCYLDSSFCALYIPDNLKFLEQQYEQSKLAL